MAWNKARLFFPRLKPYSWRAVFGMDLRSLALFRIGLGVLLVCDLLKRALALEAHYSDYGVLPRFVVEQFYQAPFFARLFLLSGDTTVVGCLFLLGGVLAFCLLIGVLTPVVSVLCFCFWSSLNYRNPLVLHTGDMYLRLLLFWGMFLPLNGRFSLDLVFSRPTSPPPNPVVSAATIGMLLQIALFYVSAGIFKHQTSEWRAGNGLELFLQIDAYLRPFGKWLLHFPWLMKGASLGTMVLEILGPILLFVPFFLPPLRLLLILSFMLFHLGIQLSVYIGLFEWMSIVALFCLLPEEFWTLWSWPKRLCAGAEHLAKRFPSFCLPQLRYRLHWSFSVLLIVCMIYIAGVNLNSYGGISRRMPGPVQWVGDYLGLGQSWSIFSRLANREMGWVMVIGRLPNGALVDVLNHTPEVSWEKPDNLAERFISHNWRRFWMFMVNDRFKSFRPYAARYLCAQWKKHAASHGELNSLQMIYITERFSPDLSQTENGKKVLLDYPCSFEPL